MMDERFSRTAMLLGEEGMARLQGSRVMLFGLGGVGGHAAEALARAGIGALCLVDFDTVSASNINRQILADDTTVGQKKTAVCAARLAHIAPRASIKTVDTFVDATNVGELLRAFAPDYIVDAIDTVDSKLAIVREARAQSIPLVSCMGTGNKLHPEKLQISDLSHTHTCPLARSVRAKLRQEGITHLPVLWSSEVPRKPVFLHLEGGRVSPGSVSFVPPVAGLMLAGYVVRQLLGIE